MVSQSNPTDGDKPLPKRQREAIAKAVADPRRFEILRHIATRHCAACSDLRECFPITAPTLSHHLSELEGAGLVTLTRRGKFVDVTFCRDIWIAYLRELDQL